MGSDHERHKATPQTQLGDGSKKPVQTDLDHLMVEEFKKAVADHTGMPADDQQYKSCEMESDQIINLACHAPAAPSTSIGSQSRENTPTLLSESTSALNATGTTNNEPDFTTDIIKSLPVLCQLAENPGMAQILQNPIALSRILKYMLYIEVKKCTASIKSDTTENIEAVTEESSKNESVRDSRQDFSFELKEDQSSLGLLNSSLVGSEPDSCDKSQPNSAPDSGIFPDSQDASLYSRTGSLHMRHGCVSDELGNLSRWHEAHKEIIDELVQAIISDATLLRHFKEKGESIDRAIAEMQGRNTACQDQFPSEFSSLDKVLEEYAGPILNMFIARINDADYDLSGSSSDGSVDVAREVAAEPGQIAPQLAEIEHMGSKDRQEIESDLNKSVKRHLTETKSDEGRRQC